MPKLFLSKRQGATPFLRLACQLGEGFAREFGWVFQFFIRLAMGRIGASFHALPTYFKKKTAESDPNPKNSRINAVHMQRRYACKCACGN